MNKTRRNPNRWKNLQDKTVIFNTARKEPSSGKYNEFKQKSNRIITVWMPSGEM